MAVKIIDTNKDIIIQYTDTTKLISFTKNITLKNMMSLYKKLTIGAIKEIRDTLQLYIAEGRQRYCQQKEIEELYNFFNSLIK